MVDVEKLSNLGKTTTSGVSMPTEIKPMSIFDGLELVDRILDKITKLQPKGNPQQQQNNIIDVPYSQNAPINDPFKRPASNETTGFVKPRQIEEAPKEIVKETVKEVEAPKEPVKVDFDEQFENYYNKTMDALKMLKIQYGDIPISQLMVNLKRDKEQIKAIVKEMF